MSKTPFPPKPPGGLPPKGVPGRGTGPLRPPQAPRSRYQHLLHDGERFFKAKDYETAFSIYRQALSEAPPGDAQALTELCRCYRKKARKAMQSEDFEKVAALLTEMLALPQMHAKALDYKVLGESLLELGQLEPARAALERAVELGLETGPEVKRLFQRLKTEELSRDMKGLH